MSTCELCGGPTRSRYGVCNRAGACRTERVRRRHGTADLAHDRKCGNCGGPLRADAKWGFCSRSLACGAAATRAARYANIDGERERANKYMKEWRAQNYDHARRSERRWRKLRRPTGKMTPGTVYFLCEAGSPYVKIGLSHGKSGGLRATIKSVQRGNPRIVYPMYTAETGDVFGAENYLHRDVFADFRVRGDGEWFRVAGDFNVWVAPAVDWLARFDR